VILDCDVLVVGGGPVGLLLGSLLARAGIALKVIEKRARPSAGSRAIGVHPPGLGCLDRIGLADALIAAGVRVRRGRAMLRGEALGVIDFASLPAPFDFVLSVPQRVTEELLSERLAALAPQALVRDAELLTCCDARDHVEATLRVGGHERTLRARYVVGCDGRRSRVRHAMGTPYVGRAYRDRFAMADLRDETALGEEAVVFVDEQGLIESFPLPGGVRRWVMSCGRGRQVPDHERFVSDLKRRTGQRVSADSAAEISGFFAERFSARSFARGRQILAGDAAHVVSPIGGQGMNLGWLDACALASALARALRSEAQAAAALAEYARTRHRASLRAARRAELYMALGFAAPLPLRALSLRALTQEPLAARAARLFTMRGLES
jgi:2-polyprenyl-6-methoxyphenol hydroxylase-like FAD-dependent oxidoreductase